MTIEITSRADGSKFSGILPIAFNIITSSSAVTVDYSTLQLMYDGQAVIKAKANSAGKSAIIINFGQKEVGKVVAEVK